VDLTDHGRMVAGTSAGELPATAISNLSSERTVALLTEHSIPFPGVAVEWSAGELLDGGRGDRGEKVDKVAVGVAEQQ
jgi:hypothetical protein